MADPPFARQLCQRMPAMTTPPPRPRAAVAMAARTGYGSGNDMAIEHLDIAPIRRFDGTVVLPGSKSLSNRVLMLAALADGVTLIRDVLDSDDTGHMLTALGKLGVSCAPAGGRDYRATGAGGPFPGKFAELFLGNAGTAVRPLTAALAFSGGRYRVSGSPRMHERPIGDLVEALQGLGANIA